MSAESEARSWSTWVAVPSDGRQPVTAPTGPQAATEGWLAEPTVARDAAPTYCDWPEALQSNS